MEMLKLEDLTLAIDNIAWKARNQVSRIERRDLGQIERDFQSIIILFIECNYSSLKFIISLSHTVSCTDIYTFM